MFNLGVVMSHVFGGNWTDSKLEVVQRYFSVYAQALKNQHFNCWYVDAFAGSGARVDSREIDLEQPRFFGVDAEDVTEAKEGSARLALRIDPPFSRYIFIERAKARAHQLEALQSEFPTLNIQVMNSDANGALTRLSTDFPRNTRAAIFIDPYGMQVQWETLLSLATTKAVDIALLFPTGPLNRLLRRDGELDDKWIAAIDAHWVGVIGVQKCIVQLLKAIYLTNPNGMKRLSVSIN